MVHRYRNWPFPTALTDRSEASRERRLPRYCREVQYIPKWSKGRTHTHRFYLAYTKWLPYIEDREFDLLMWISSCHLRSIGYRSSAPTHCTSRLPCASWRVKVWSHCSGSSAHLFTWDSWFFPLSMAWPILGPRGKCHQRGLWLQASWPADHCQRKAGSSLAQAYLVHGERTLAFPPVVRRIRSQEMQSNSHLAPL